jgi:hypothetical protein
MFAVRFKRADIVPIAIAVVLPLFFFLIFAVSQSADADYFTVSYAGQDRAGETYSLGEDRRLTLTGNGYTLEIEVKDGAVAVVSSDCPGCDCVRTGAVRKAGSSIVCIPAGIVITVGGGGDYDALAG